MPAAAQNFDTGSIFGNLFNDLKHLPERTIQQSRAMRQQAQMQAIQEEANKRAVQNSIDQNAISAFQSAVPDANVPLMPDGRPDRRVMAGLMKQAGIADKKIQNTLNAEGDAAATTARLGAEKQFNDTIIDQQRGAIPAAPAPQSLGQQMVGAQPGQSIGGAVGAGIAKLLGRQTGAPAMPAAAAPAPVLNDEQARLKFRQDQALLQKQQAAQESSDIEAAKQRALTNEKERDAYRSAFGKDPGPDALDEKGQLNAAGLKAVADAKAKGQLTQTQRNAEYVVDQGIKAGTIKPEQREEAIAVFSQQLMGRAPALPQAERDAAVGNAKYLQSLAALNNSVDKVPKGGFGPIDNRLKLLGNRLFGTNQEMATVDQDYKTAAAAKAFGEGGKQLTGTEKEITFGQLGDPNSESFPTQLAHHFEQARNVVNLQLERLRASPHRFTADGQAAIAQLEKALAGINSAAPAVDSTNKPAGGSKFTVEEIH